MTKPDFYLFSTDHREFEKERACWVKKKVTCTYMNDKNRDGLLVEFSPSVNGQKYGLGDKNIAHAIVYARFKGSSLFPINEWPMHVLLFRILNNQILETGTIENEKDIELWAWAELYESDNRKSGGEKSGDSHYFRGQVDM